MGEALRCTPLTDWHRSNGARMVPFAGFDMPVQYAQGIQEEVRLVRNECGIFDLCHMGRMVLRGPDRVRAADHVLSQNVAKIPLGAIRYSLICTPDGTVVDDVLVYHDPEVVHVVINASGREVDDAWFREHTAKFDCEVANVSDDQTMLALQGPRSKEILPKISDVDVAALRYYRFTHGKLLGDIAALVSRTGYTGEDGFELFFPLKDAGRVWGALLEAGGTPIGLGARDVCRTEAGMPLYGHEINREIAPLEADLNFGMDLETEFIGSDALRAQRDQGIPRGLVGLDVEGRRVPREGCRVLRRDQEIGFVTSGTFSPTLNRPIAMALVRREFVREGENLLVDVRGRTVQARIGGLPFYSRKRKKKTPGGKS
ncbi:MAG: glycine cleavage system aminomethyltransferase GcvT [Planctomycetota bacterium]|jgi:aminomethyltransferase